MAADKNEITNSGSDIQEGAELTRKRTIEGVTENKVDEEIHKKAKLDSDKKVESSNNEAKEKKVEKDNSTKDAKPEEEEPLKEKGPKEESLNEESLKEKNSDSKPKFVFGQGSKFGGAFSGLNGKKNVFASEESKLERKSIFETSSKFGNAFQSAASKKSIFDAIDKKQDSDEKESKSEEPEERSKANLYQAVQLNRTEVKSGEEEETSVFQCKAKLYVLNLNNLSEGWKERGVGILHVNTLKDKDKTNSRIVMRTLGILKVILNVSIGKNFEIFKGMESSLHSEKFIRFNHIETDASKQPGASKNGMFENQTLVQFAVKLGKAEAVELYDTIKGLIPPNAE